MTDTRSLQAWMIEHRRHLHAHPEVGLALPQTHAYLEAALTGLGLSPEVHADAGLTVRIPGSSGSDGVRVLRADMDALPLQENTALPFASTIDGAMHACGHDLHMAMLLGAARAFTEQQPRHDVVLAFQPGEEADRGAVRTLAHSNLQLDGETRAFAIHVHATLPAGSVNYRGGTFMAAGDWFTVTFSGPGGHASAPQLTGNPADGAAYFVTGLHDLVARLEAGPDHREHLVATVSEIRTGSTVNVIAASGRLRGTIRTLSPTTRQRLVEGLGALTRTSATRARLTGDLQLTEGYPAVVNDDAFLHGLLASLQGTLLADRCAPMAEPSMVIEDFAYFLQRWPGAMVYLGARVGDATAFNHSAEVLFDEEVMTAGVVLHRAAADLGTVSGQ